MSQATKNGAFCEERAAGLREAMVDELVAAGRIRTAPVEAAFRTVPRHLFLPGTALETAYQDTVVVTKRDERGRDISSASAPWLVATMLEDGRSTPGSRVLEIGAGTGYNAALIRHLVGAAGRVVTVDIDPDCVSQARAALDAVGYQDVEVVHADGAYGAPRDAPYDLITVTVGAADLADAWWEQLGDQGRLVVPLRLRGLSREMVFEREGDHLRSTVLRQCGFVPMQGDGRMKLDTVDLGDGLLLRVDDGQPVNIEALRAAVAPGAERHEEWTGVPLRPGEGVLPQLDMWLASQLDAYGKFNASAEAVEQGRAARTFPLIGSATWSEDTLAYYTWREADGSAHSELGVVAHGPNSPAVALRMAEHIRAWDTQHRGGPGPVIRAYRAGTLQERLGAGRVVDRRDTRLVIGWS